MASPAALSTPIICLLSVANCKISPDAELAKGSCGLNVWKEHLGLRFMFSKHIKILPFHKVMKKLDAQYTENISLLTVYI